MLDKIKFIKKVLEGHCYKNSDLYEEWQRHIKTTPSEQQKDFYVFRFDKTLEALKKCIDIEVELGE